MESIVPGKVMIALGKALQGVQIWVGRIGPTASRQAGGVDGRLSLVR